MTFSTEAEEDTHRPAGLDARARGLLSEAAVSRARRRRPVTRGGWAPAAGMRVALVEAGTTLGRCFLDGEAGQALADEVAAAVGGARRSGSAVDVPDRGLAALPWRHWFCPGR